MPELRAQFADLGDLATELEKDPDGAVKLALRPAFRRGDQSVGGAVRLLLILDQLEELYTSRRLTGDDRVRFLVAVEALRARETFAPSRRCAAITTRWRTWTRVSSGSKATAATSNCCRLDWQRCVRSLSSLRGSVGCGSIPTTRRDARSPTVC